MSETKAVTFSWSRTVEVSDLTSEQVVIYCCDDDNAPSYKSWNTTENCRLSADLSTIPRSKFTRRKSKKLGDPDQYQITYELEMTMDSASISFVLLIDGMFILSTPSMIYVELIDFLVVKRCSIWLRSDRVCLKSTKHALIFHEQVLAI